MKKLLTLTASLVLGFSALSQDKINLVIFSEDGYGFYAYINGVKQNAKAESNVKVTGLSPNVSLRIEFEDTSKPQLKQNMSLDPGMEHTVRIKEDSKKQLKLRYFGQTALNDQSSAGAQTVAYHTAETPAPAAATAQSGTQAKSATDQTTINSTTTTRTSGSSNPDNVNVNMNMAGVGISMNVTGMDNTSSTTMNSTSSTTVTRSSSGNTNADQSMVQHDNTSAATAKTGCGQPMSSVDFNKMKESVEAKPFSDTKMSTAKVATKNACLSVNQIKTLCKLFSMDDDKLAYAKYAYASCSDKSNYYQVSDVFSFSATTEELNKFLEEQN